MEEFLKGLLEESIKGFFGGISRTPGEIFLVIPGGIPGEIRERILERILDGIF